MTTFAQEQAVDRAILFTGEAILVLFALKTVEKSGRNVVRKFSSRVECVSARCTFFRNFCALIFTPSGVRLSRVFLRLFRFRVSQSLLFKFS